MQKRHHKPFFAYIFSDIREFTIILVRVYTVCDLVAVPKQENYTVNFDRKHVFFIYQPLFRSDIILNEFKDQFPQ